jgi:hypothetical protein
MIDSQLQERQRARRLQNVLRYWVLSTAEAKSNRAAKSMPMPKLQSPMPKLQPATPSPTGRRTTPRTTPARSTPGGGGGGVGELVGDMSELLVASDARNAELEAKVTMLQEQLFSAVRPSPGRLGGLGVWSGKSCFYCEVV